MVYLSYTTRLTFIFIILIIIYLLFVIYTKKITGLTELWKYFRNLFLQTTDNSKEEKEKEDKEKGPKPIKINIFDNQYLTEEGRHVDHMIVPLNQTIVWENLDATYHTVTHLQKRNFNSGNLKLNDLYKFTFDQPGRYWVYCRQHPKNMIHINVLNRKGRPVPHTFDQDYALEYPFKTISPPKNLTQKCKEKGKTEPQMDPYPLLSAGSVSPDGRFLSSPLL